MKRSSAAKTATVALTVLTLGSLSAQAATRSPSTIRQQTSSTIRQQTLAPATLGTTASNTALTQSERDGLVFMREEEKLARDVYDALFTKWGIRQFSNIARSEATHTSAVKALLDRYAIRDPAATSKPGVFVNPDLQALYTKLVKQGSTSPTEALKVGALIEEVDIADLQKRATTTADIDQVYTNLENGSRNHLRAFTAGLAARGVTYVSPTVPAPSSSR